jgi:hypothetical protein
MRTWARLLKEALPKHACMSKEKKCEHCPELNTRPASRSDIIPGGYRCQSRNLLLAFNEEA